MPKNIRRNKPVAATLYLIFTLCIIFNVACSGSDSEPTISIGQSRIKLIPFPYPGFTQVGESTEAYKRVQEGLLEGDSVLALYINADAWNNLESTTDETAPILMQGASIKASRKKVDHDKTINLAQFDEFAKRVIPGLSAKGFEIIETSARYFTSISIDPLRDGLDLKGVTTFILVQGKILELDAFCLSGSPVEDQLQSLSLAWRDAYLEQTKP
jgi:hypothetical protein